MANIQSVLVDYWLPELLAVVNDRKLIAFGEDATQARSRLRSRLREVMVGGKLENTVQVRALPPVGFRIEKGRVAFVVDGLDDHFGYATSPTEGTLEINERIVEQRQAQL